jgi:hypothetical protein
MGSPHEGNPNEAVEDILKMIFWVIPGGQNSIFADKSSKTMGHKDDWARYGIG